MNKYKFNSRERFVIWKEYGCKCFWCGEPYDFKHTTIDHVFPEKLLNDTVEFNRIKKLYSLPDNFEINSFSNWVPAHSSCNAKKSIILIINSPAFLLMVEQIIKKAEDVTKAYELISKQVSKDKAFGELLSNLEIGNISDSDLIQLLKETSIYHIEDLNLSSSDLYNLPEGWKVHSVNEEDDSLTVVYEGRYGRVPRGTHPDSSWLCPICKRYGPWTGNMCLSCGHFCQPND